MHGHAVAIGIVVGDRGVHLHLVLADLGAVVGAFAHQIGLGEALLDVAELESTSRSMLPASVPGTAPGAIAALQL